MQNICIFLIKRVGWIITKIYAHHTFEKFKFKKDLVVMNQVSHENAKAFVEKDFYKLMNNANFGYGCRNNIDNCKFTALFDEIDEVSYNQKYLSHTVFNEAYKDFACSITMKEQIEQEHNKEVMKITPEDPCAKAKKYSLGQKRASKIDAADSMTAKKQRKKPFKDSDQNLDKALHNPNAKMIIDFQSESAVSRNSSTVNKNDNMKVTTRFFSGKRLMFEK